MGCGVFGFRSTLLGTLVRGLRTVFFFFFFFFFFGCWVLHHPWTMDKPELL